MWQAQFLSHTHETLETYVFYIDLEMILVPFFDIPNQKPVNCKTYSGMTQNMDMTVMAKFLSQNPSWISKYGINIT